MSATKRGRFYVVRFTRDGDEQIECSSEAEALALAAKLRKRGLASAFERRAVGSLLLLPGLAPVTPRKRKRPPPTLTKAEAAACIRALGAAFTGDEEDVIALLGEDRAVWAAARRAREKLLAITRGE